MSEFTYSYFVIAAVISSELDKASKVAKNLTITASNARAVALRAGERAAGFRPLTDFIDRLANMTVQSSSQINKLAAALSKTAADKFRTDNALARFDIVYDKVAGSVHINSLDVGYQRTKSDQLLLAERYQKQLLQLTNELDTLKDELRTAVILATLSRVEASQAGLLYQDALNNVAEKVESSALEIKVHINTSQRLVADLQQE